MSRKNDIAPLARGFKRFRGFKGFRGWWWRLRRKFKKGVRLRRRLCRRVVVRFAQGATTHPIGALPRTPFPASRDFAPVGSMSLDFQVASLSYKSSSFATSRGNEKIDGTGYCVTYDTDSQSRNAPCVPFRGRGPRSGEGMYEGKNDYDTRYGRDRRRRHYKTHRPIGRYHNPRGQRPRQT